MKQLWLACGLFACGNVTTKSPDAGGGSADTTPPMLVSSTPAADATDVALMEPLQLVFDESLDPASITSDVFALGCWECQPVFTTPSYDDATHTVTLAPLIPLDPDVPYILMIGSGLRDVAGNAFAGEDVVFHTRKNTVTRLVSYAGTGMPSSWSSYTLDAAGNIAALYSYSGPGPDAVWLTPDDVISAHMTWVTSGPTTVRTTYAAGTDGKFGTADDVVSETYETDNNSDGNPIAYWTRDGAGTVTQMETQTWDGRWITETDTHSGAGADGQWNTADDLISRVMKYQYDARHRMVRQLEIDAGPDHVANTADDVMLDYSQQAYDAHDRYGTHALYAEFGLDGMKGNADDGIGPDGVWFTADDIPNYYNTATYDSTAMTAAGTSYTGPGPDHVWMTADDLVSSSFTSTYDAHWVHTGNTYLNASNVVSGYTTYHHDGDGLLLDDTDYTSPGPDSVWHTADDRPGWRYDFDATH